MEAAFQAKAKLIYLLPKEDRKSTEFVLEPR